MWQCGKKATRHLPNAINTHMRELVSSTVSRSHTIFPPIHLQLDKGLLNNRLLGGMLWRRREGFLCVPTIRRRSLRLRLPDGRQLCLLCGAMLPVRLGLLLLLLALLLTLRWLRWHRSGCLCWRGLVGMHGLLQARIGRVGDRGLGLLGLLSLGCGLLRIEVEGSVWVCGWGCPDGVWY